MSLSVRLSVSLSVHLSVCLSVHFSHKYFVLNILTFQHDFVLFLTLPGQALHWVYDVDKLQGILAGVSEPEFMDQHHCPFYRVETGGHGPCGDQAVVQLQSLAECKGEL